VPSDDQASQNANASKGPTTGFFILVLGAVEVAVVYALLSVDSPIAVWAWRATETWPGRLILAAIGLAVICVSMITILTLAERRKH